MDFGINGDVGVKCLTSFRRRQPKISSVERLNPLTEAGTLFDIRRACPQVPSSAINKSNTGGSWLLAFLSRGDADAVDDVDALSNS